MKGVQRLPAWLWPMVFLCGLRPIGAHADEEGLRALQQKVEELTATVRQLQDRIKVLEQDREAPWVPAARSSPAEATSSAPGVSTQVETAPTVVQSAPPAAKASVDDKIVLLRKSWQRIGAGMSREAVRETLGPPSKEMLINGKSVWYYVYSGLGAGSVFFKSDGRVSSSQPPNLGWGF